MYFDDGPMPPEKCEGCDKRIDVWPENEDAWILFHRCRDQLILGDSGYIVGPRHDVLWAWVDRMDEEGLIEDSPIEIMEKVLGVFGIVHDLHNKEVKRKYDESRSKNK